MSDYLELGDEAFMMDLPAGWRLVWAKPFTARIDSGIAAAPILVAVDSERHPDGLRGKAERRYLSRDDGRATSPMDYRATYSCKFQPDYRGQGPHILVVGRYAIPPVIIRRIDFAIPVGESRPDGTDENENEEYIAWAMQYEPLSSLMSFLPRVAVANEETALDRIATLPGLTRENYRDLFHMLVPEGWNVGPDPDEDPDDEGPPTFLIAPPLDEPEEQETQWLLVDHTDLPLAPPDGMARALLKSVGENLLDRYGEDETTTVPARLALRGDREILVESYARYEEDGKPLEDRRGVRVALVGRRQVRVFYRLVYPLSALEDPAFPARAGQHWQRFLDGWIAPAL